MKRIIYFLIILSCFLMAGSETRTVHAYTEAEKAQAKAWLSSHGYAPTRSGAEQAYQDYLNGKWDEEAKKYLGDGSGDGLDEEEESEEEKSGGDDEKEGGSDEDGGKDSEPEETSETAAEVTTEAEELTTEIVEVTTATEEAGTKTEAKEQTDTNTEKQEQKKQSRRRMISGVLIGVAALAALAGGYVLFLKKKE